MMDIGHKYYISLITVLHSTKNYFSHTYAKYKQDSICYYTQNTAASAVHLWVTVRYYVIWLGLLLGILAHEDGGRNAVPKRQQHITHWRCPTPQNTEYLRARNSHITTLWYDMMIRYIWHDIIWYNTFFKCKWVDTRWQYYTTNLHPNNT